MKKVDLLSAQKRSVFRDAARRNRRDTLKLVSRNASLPARRDTTERSWLDDWCAATAAILSTTERRS
jgi:hypothetical protein